VYQKVDKQMTDFEKTAFLSMERKYFDNTCAAIQLLFNRSLTVVQPYKYGSTTVKVRLNLKQSLAL
jgi:hypothetical protein